MPDVTAAMVKQLREATGAGMMDCKRALIEADGDLDRATELLREKGLASAAKRAGRSANQGLVDAYIHFNNTVGVLIEVNCETDFVANTDEFRQLVKDLALHVWMLLCFEEGRKGHGQGAGLAAFEIAEHRDPDGRRRILEHPGNRLQHVGGPDARQRGRHRLPHPLVAVGDMLRQLRD